MEQHVALANKARIELEIAQAVGIRVGTVDTVGNASSEVILRCSNHPVSPKAATRPATAAGLLQ
jgi:hypothetical protein